MDGHKHRMLLVDDDAETRTVMRRILALCLRGWEIEEAGTLAEGLARLRPPPDCLSWSARERATPPGSVKTLAGTGRRRPEAPRRDGAGEVRRLAVGSGEHPGPAAGRTASGRIPRT
jgi:hypothetical protein